jgi:hypothetical protein
MVKPALILLVILTGCAGTPHPVIEYRTVEVVKPLAVPCIEAADRRAAPRPLADGAMPTTAKQLVATLIAEIKEWTAWGVVANHQLDACTKG